jgi:nicotinate-nucleotide pyrophosphorylase (carboxylating)
LDVAEAVFREVDGSLRWSTSCRDGQVIQAGVVVAEVRGSARAILTGERCALNFLQRLSGVATKTAEYVKAVEGTQTKILDTRKTTPGLRALERQAVRSGGGTNHRAGLYDGILVKENHQVFMNDGVWGEALKKAREEYPDLCLVVEADTVELAEKLLSQPIDRVLLDNMSNEKVGRVVALRKKMGSTVGLEASGGVTVARARELAAIGVEWVSVGGLTHSARAIDFSLDLVPE